MVVDRLGAPAVGGRAVGGTTISGQMARRHCGGLKVRGLLLASIR